MPFEDKTIVCSDCNTEFVHSAEDQERYAERGFTNDPKRCRECREKRKQQSRGGGGGGGGGGGNGGYRGGGGGARREFDRRPPREQFEVICAECGTTTTVPFKPRGDRPVYCRDCFRQKQ